METNKNELDELLKHAMQLNNDEVPEPSKDRLEELRSKVRRRGLKNRGIVRMLNINVKLYQAFIATAAIVTAIIVLRPVANQQGNTIKGSGSIDTAAVLNGSSSMKHDSFLVRNFTTSVY
jgi:hypothetical protein